MPLRIFVDSSTKQSAKTNKYGQSVAAWAVWLTSDTSLPPERAGVIFFRHHGPNKTFYEGIIRALELCLSKCWNESVAVYGDCEPVIKQLNGDWAVGTMKPEFDQVQALVRKYRARGATVSFQYLNENDDTYSRIDQLAKRSKDHIVSNLKPKKTKH